MHLHFLTIKQKNKMVKTVLTYAAAIALGLVFAEIGKNLLVKVMPESFENYEEE